MVITQNITDQINSITNYQTYLKAIKVICQEYINHHRPHRGFFKNSCDTLGIHFDDYKAAKEMVKKISKTEAAIMMLYSSHTAPRKDMDTAPLSNKERQMIIDFICKKIHNKNFPSSLGTFLTTALDTLRRSLLTNDIDLNADIATSFDASVQKEMLKHNIR